MRKPPLDPSLFTFSPTTGTVTFAAGSTRPTHQGQIVSIVNTSNEIYLYLPVQAGRGGAYNATTGVLTLEIGTATMSSGDALQIVIDDSDIAATGALQATGNVLLSGINDKLPALNAGQVPVSGTFWQATQPVSGSVSVNNLPASQAVTGTFWQATQPVSGPVTNTQLIARLPILSLSGTRLQVEPSLATDAATATNQATGNATLGGIDSKMPAFSTAGTPSADVLTVQGVTSGTPLRISPGILEEIEYNSGTNTIAINTQLMLIDCSNCSAVSIHVLTFPNSGSIVAEWSNNGISFGLPQTLQQASTSTQWGTSITGVGTYVAPRMGKWLQLRQSVASTGGNNTSIAVVQLADSPAVSAIAQLVGGSTNIIGGVVQGYSASTGFAAATKTSIFSAASTNAAVVKSSAGKVIGFYFTNTTADFVAIRLYNLTVAPTVGSSTTFARIVVPPNDCVSYSQEGGYLHSVGIAIAITAGLGDSDNTPVAAGAIIGELFTI